MAFGWVGFCVDQVFSEPRPVGSEVRRLQFQFRWIGGGGGGRDIQVQARGPFRLPLLLWPWRKDLGVHFRSIQRTSASLALSQFFFSWEGEVGEFCGRYGRQVAAVRGE